MNSITVHGLAVECTQFQRFFSVFCCGDVHDRRTLAPSRESERVSIFISLVVTLVAMVSTPLMLVVPVATTFLRRRSGSTRHRLSTSQNLVECLVNSQCFVRSYPAQSAMFAVPSIVILAHIPKCHPEPICAVNGVRVGRLRLVRGPQDAFEVTHDKGCCMAFCVIVWWRTC